VLKKRQDADEKDNAKNIKDKIENLTREGKERFVREYVRRKINMLLEQTAPEEPNAEEDPTAAAPEAPAQDPTAAAPEAPAPDPTAAAPDPTAAAPEDPATATDTPPAAEAPVELTPQETEGRVITSAATEMSKEGGVGKVKMINKILNIALQETDPEDKSSFYALLQKYAIKKRSKIQTK
jgi:hypothetical protein